MKEKTVPKTTHNYDNKFTSVFKVKQTYSPVVNVLSLTVYFMYKSSTITN